MGYDGVSDEPDDGDPARPGVGLGSFNQIRGSLKIFREGDTFEVRRAIAPRPAAFERPDGRKGSRPWDVAVLPDGTEVPDLLPRKRPGLFKRPPTPPGVWSACAAAVPPGDSQYWPFFLAGLVGGLMLVLSLAPGGQVVLYTIGWIPIGLLALGAVATAIGWLARAPPRAPDGERGVSTFTHVPRERDPAHSLDSSLRWAAADLGLLITNERLVHRQYTGGKSTPAYAPVYLWRLGDAALAVFQIKGYLWHRRYEWVTLWTAGRENADTHCLLKGLVLARLAEAEHAAQAPAMEAVEPPSHVRVAPSTLALPRGDRPEPVSDSFGWAASGLEEEGGPWPDARLPHEGPSSLPFGYWGSRARRKTVLHNTVHSWMRVDGGGRALDEIARAVGDGVREGNPQAAPAFAGRKGGRRWASLDGTLHIELRDGQSPGTWLMELTSTLDPPVVRALKGAIERRLYATK